MIFVRPQPQHRLLFIGGDIFDGIKLPSDLNTTLVNLPSNRENYLNYAVSQNVSAVLTIPQPNVNTVCESSWLRALTSIFPVGLIWYDYNVYHEWVHKLKNCFHIVLDNQRVHDTNIVPLWTPINVELTCPQEERNINVGFYGKIDCEQRRSALKFLINRGIPVFTTGNDWNVVDAGMMYHYMRMTKIILNFSNTRFYPDHQKHQLKGRVIEAMRSGAMLMETENDQSDIYFQPGKDLIWFKSHEDMIEKIKYYLKHDTERIKIASNAQYLCKVHYSLDNWWRAFLPKLLNFKPNLVKI